jgi:TonB family protein
MARATRDGRRLLSAWILSVAAHASITAAGLAIAHHVASRVGAGATTSSPVASVPPADTFEVELPPMASGSVADAPPAPTLAPVAPPRGGGEATPRPDTGHAGRGGSDEAPDPAMNLADQDDGILLGDAALSRLDRSQVQRLRTSRTRAARENWRASREPMELTFVAQGAAGRRPERRTPAATDPSAGGATGGEPTRHGAALGAPEAPAGVGEQAHAIGGPIEGAPRDSEGVGVRDGRAGHDHRASGAVARARPEAEEGTPSTPSSRQGKPSDTVDSEQEVATRMQSILHASTAGGARGVGVGGANGPGAAGSGGLGGQGSKARALGTGAGPGLDDAASDPRRIGYERAVRAKIHPLWANAFPKWAIAEGLQGTVVVTLAIRADGSLASAAITRPSGIPEFDANCQRAAQAAAPFGPLPAELGPTFRLAMAFDARNPAVRPKAAASRERRGAEPEP